MNFITFALLQQHGLRKSIAPMNISAIQCGLNFLNFGCVKVIGSYRNLQLSIILPGADIPGMERVEG
jgi:hypothetical protein